MSEIEAGQLLLNTGGGIGGVLLIIIAIRKLITIFSTDSLTSKSNDAYSTLIKDLTQELTRVKDDLVALKKQFDQERQDMIEKIDRLENEFNNLKIRYESMRNEAIDAYTHISKNEEDYGNVEDIKQRLMRIIVVDAEGTDNVI